MGIGGILIAFGAVVVALSLLARQGAETRLELPAMGMLATGSLVIGAVMFAAGFLLSRFRGNSADYTSRRP